MNFRDAFKIFDRDNDGFITIEELKIAMRMIGDVLTEDEIQLFMDEADAVNRKYCISRCPISLLSGWERENFLR